MLTYDREHSSSAMPSFTLAPSGDEKSRISLQPPELLGISLPTCSCVPLAIGQDWKDPEFCLPGIRWPSTPWPPQGDPAQTSCSSSLSCKHVRHSQNQYGTQLWCLSSHPTPATAGGVPGSPQQLSQHSTSPVRTSCPSKSFKYLYRAEYSSDLWEAPRQCSHRFCYSKLLSGQKGERNWIGEMQCRFAIRSIFGGVTNAAAKQGW